MTDCFAGFNKTVVAEAAKNIQDAGNAATRNPVWQTNFYSGYTSAIIRAAAEEVYFIADRDLLRAIAAWIDVKPLNGAE
jgi:hypothetical protein